ncbi:hypothetical protein JQK88_32515 [Mesorhizobium caraganae]|uniref:hypothetical protein n=1 Tax=Mesorhizobium caraganae TaxID=483206 RepID=UPI00177CF1FC|nr:hypothetical protein [Mesorhizobium caraganae]MBM2715835.1 hypothetical protein [Mesorhizobium caraganae]
MIEIYKQPSTETSSAASSWLDGTVTTYIVSVFEKPHWRRLLTTKGQKWMK